MHYFREYHIVTLISLENVLLYHVVCEGRTTEHWITGTARLGLRAAEPGNTSTSKVTIRQPGIRMLDYDLKLQFTVKLKCS